MSETEKNKSYPQIKRQQRQEELRTYLSERGKVSYIFDNIEKMEKSVGAETEEDKLDNQELTALKYSIDSRLRLLNKYLPDLRHTELAAEGGGDLVIKVMEYGSGDAPKPVES